MSVRVVLEIMETLESCTLSTAVASDRDCQVRLLPGVSRTFALTIPQLPEPLRTVVTNAYLLCRIADTIEDDPQLHPEQKIQLHEQFRSVLAGTRSPQTFTEELLGLLSPNTPLPELELIRHTPTVINCFRSFTPKQQASLQRCINIMSTGMPEFQRTASLAGLENLASLDQYCYCVAGVVGEMLTELFCDYAPELDQHRIQLMELAISFGQALQMTNILKDFWEDRQRGICWLPRDIFLLYGLNLPEWTPEINPKAFNQILKHLILIARRHLRNALQYTLLIPSRETGIRRFTFWAIALAALTLRNIYRHPNFTNSAEVKMSRRKVKTTILISNQSCHSNRLLTYLFSWLTRELT